MISVRPFSLVLFVACLLTLMSVNTFAQEFRGSISGRVTEGSGAVVANATVKVISQATNTTFTSTTNEQGEYLVLYLTPGLYSVEVSANGFKKSLREKIEVRVSSKLELDFALEVGQAQDTINVTSQTPLLEASTASAGQVVDQRRITELPLSDGNPFTLTRITPGISYLGDLKFSRISDQNGMSSMAANGAPGRNEFTLDGSPNMADNGGVNSGRVAYVPPAEAVQEFKVETASYDGQQAHTAGATINVTLKSGTNSLHGSVYEFVRNDVLSANDFFLNRTNLVTTPARDKNKDGKADRDPLRYNRYGFTVGGPAFLPRFGEGGKVYYDGRNRSFWFFSMEKLDNTNPEVALFTVPTAKQRNGDFSELLPSIVIYDPATARVEGTRVRRDPFLGNIIPTARLNPIAQKFLSYYPLPNTVGDAQGFNNFLGNNPRPDKYNAQNARFDQTLTERQRAFVRYSHNASISSRGNWPGVINGVTPTGTTLTRDIHSSTIDYVNTLSDNTILNLRSGFSRFVQQIRRFHQDAINPASLGFPASTAALFGPEQYLPRFNITGYSPIGDPLGAKTAHMIYSAQATLTKVVRKHSFKMGYDWRSYRENSYTPGNPAGLYTFGADFTRGPLDNAASAAIGQSLASLLLGLPTAGSIDRNTARSNQSLYHGMFLHDDWKVTPKLTLNLGLRYEYEGAPNERYNRNIRGFDLTAASPVEAAAKSAYAISPIPEVAVSSFNVKGGLLYASDSNRSFWEADTNNVQPRIGVSYQLNDKTVLRGGWGMYTVPFVITGTIQTGFSLPTPITPTVNNGLTFQATLANPFPTGVQTPLGASLGLSALLGQTVTYVPTDLNNSQAQRWSFGMQRELPGNWLIELQYVGNRGAQLLVETNALNAIPKQYLSTSATRDVTTINFLTTLVTNPFRNLIPGTGLNGATVQRQQLLRPFPQFTGITTNRNDGTSNYHSAQLRVEKRFSQGFTALLGYTWSKFLERASFRNDVDTEFEKRLSDADIPHRIVVSGICELPFGRGRKWGNKWHRATDAALGGWQVQGIWQAQSGRPLTIGNVYYNGDITRLKTDIGSANVDGTAFNVSGFYFNDAAVQTNGVVDPSKQRTDSRIQLLNNYRTLPTRWTGFRSDALNIWDLSTSKNFTFTERFKLQLRGEFLNAFNKPIFDNPVLDPTSANFGKVPSQANLPRSIQIGLRLLF